MMPTEHVMAIAVDNAPTNTDVRRSEAIRLRDASKASTPKSFFVHALETESAAFEKAGIASADAAARRIAAR